MRAEYINPFIESARHVIEQTTNISPEPGKLGIKDLKFTENYVWIQIGMIGQMTGDVVFGIKESVALKLISAMMGGFVVTQMDDIGRSAISELGNMISGNASTILFNQGVRVDITPPKIIESAQAAGFQPKKALTIPLNVEGVGVIEMLVVVT